MNTNNIGAVVKASFLSFGLLLCSQADAQEVSKIKAGDKLVYETVTYNSRGREVVVDSTRSLQATVTEAEGSYTVKSDLGTMTYLRAGHVITFRDIPNFPSEPVPEAQRVSWLPLNGDFSKPYGGSFVIANPNCGLGKMTFEATAKPAKYTLMVAGKSTELDVQEIQVDGKWMLSGQCGSGKQVEKIVYSPVLDFIMERDSKSYLPNGFLNRGNGNKLKSIN